MANKITKSHYTNVPKRPAATGASASKSARLARLTRLIAAVIMAAALVFTA